LLTHAQTRWPLKRALKERRPQAHRLARASAFVRLSPGHAWGAHQERPGTLGP
jgi:hypothetical protein